MNIVVISGNLVREPEAAVTANGKSNSRFDVAVNEYYNGKENTTFLKVSCWDKTADFVNNYCKKGETIVVYGRLKSYEFTTRNGEKKSGLEILASNVEKPNSRKKEEVFNYTYKDAQNDIAKDTTDTKDPYDDIDVPF